MPNETWPISIHDFSKTGVEPYPLISRRGLIQMAFHLLLSTNYPSSWKVDVGQGHGMAEIPSRPWGRMTFLLMRPWRNCNAIDEDGRAWYDDSNLAMFVWLSTSVAPMAGVTALASPSHLCAQNDGPGHGRSDGPGFTQPPLCQNDGPGHGRSDGLGHVVSDGLDFNLVSPMSRVTALTLVGCTRVLSDGLGHGRNDGLGFNLAAPMSRVTPLPMAAVSEDVGGGGTAYGRIICLL
ncbi:unnamed protein product [Prunus brigantina]